MPKKQPKKIDKNAVRLFIEIGLIGVLLGLMLSILSEAIYEAITGIDPTLEIAFLIFWLIFALMFILLGIFAVRISISMIDSGYNISPGGMFRLMKRRSAALFSKRGFIGLIIVLPVATILSAGLALLLAALLYVARNPEMFFPPETMPGG